MTYDLLKTIMQTLQVGLYELALKSQEPMLLQRMPFGKYKGEHPSTVDRGYWRWALGNMTETDADLRFTAEHYLNH